MSHFRSNPFGYKLQAAFYEQWNTSILPSTAYYNTFNTVLRKMMKVLIRNYYTVDHISPLSIQVSLGGLQLVEGRLLAALRVLLASDLETVQKHDLNTLQSLSAEAPLGIANEVAVFRTLIALCVIALEHFPTKVMEDESLLKQGVSASTELAIKFRIEKKSMIIDIMRNLSKRVKLLTSKEMTAMQG